MSCGCILMPDHSTFKLFTLSQGLPWLDSRRERCSSSGRGWITFEIDSLLAFQPARGTNCVISLIDPYSLRRVRLDEVKGNAVGSAELQDARWLVIQSIAGRAAK